MAEDKGANWREKYLDALDQQDKLERTFGAQVEALRRALIRVSVSADGQDEKLDALLSELRETMRGSVSGDTNSLLTRLDEAALSFEQKRDHNALTVRESLAATLKPLQQLDLSRSVKKDITQYLGQLSERSKKIRLYPAMLQELAKIQQQALQEIEQPKVGFWQKLVGNGQEKAPEKTETDAAVESQGDKSHTEDKEPPSPTAYAPTAFAPVPLNAAPATTGISAAELSPEFCEKVMQIIQQFLSGLEHETPLVKKVHAIRARLEGGMSSEKFIAALDSLRDLMMQAYLNANQAFADYLKNVNQELADVYALVGGAVESESSRRNASTELQNSIHQEMATLESNVDLATDLNQLKSQVKSQIGNIRQALDQYHHAEQVQQQLATQLEALGTKVKTMEVEAQKNREVLEAQRYKALHDPLTGLPNREFYNERAVYELQRWQRYQRPLTLAVFDIDHFKKINDNYGHQAGDRVLKVIGSSVAKRLREVDFFCRFGGEEFIAIMPETSLAEAMPVLDKIRTAIANASFNYKEQPLAITLSIGATEFKEGDDLEIAFARADQALYSAKSAGRNLTRSI